MLMVTRTLAWVLKSEGGNSFADGSWGTGGEEEIASHSL